MDSSQLQVSDFEIELVGNLEDEIKTIGSEFVGGTLYTGRSFARAARCIIENKYQGIEIVDEVHGGKIIFTTQESFLEYLNLRFGISLSSMKEHLTNYRRMVVGLGMPWERAFKASVNCPGSLTRSLPEIARFDRSGKVEEIHETKIIALPTVNKQEFSEATDKLEYALPRIAEFIEEASAMDNPKESAKHFRKTLGKNTVSFTIERDGAICLHWEENSIDPSTGEVSTSGYGDVEWRISSGIYPHWVIEKMASSLHADLK